MNINNLSLCSTPHRKLSLRLKHNFIISRLNSDKRTTHIKSKSEKNSPAGIGNIYFKDSSNSKKTFTRDATPLSRLIRSEKVSPRELKLKNIPKSTKIQKMIKINKKSNNFLNIYINESPSKNSPKISSILHKKTNSCLTERLSSSKKKVQPEFAKEKEELIKLIMKHFKQEICELNTSIKFYKIIKLLGQGAFGKVVLAVQILTGIKVAIKLIDRSYLQDDHSKRKAFREIFILKKIKSIYVIKILEFFESDENVFIVMEYMQGGDLLSYLKRYDRVSIKQCKNLFYQILKGAYAIHINGVLHRDFKLDNILLNKAQDQIKICDFGVSKVIRKGEIIRDQCGTPAYLAPEIVLDGGYEGYWSDIWSLGVLLYSMACGTVPFKANNISELHKAILIGKYGFPEFLNEDIKDLIRKMMQSIPKNRISLEDALKHQWFDDCDKRNDYEIKEAPLRIEENIVKSIESFGYPRQYIINTIEYRALNHINAIYNTLLKYWVYICFILSYAVE